MSVRRGLKLTERHVRLVESAAIEHAKYADDPATAGAWKAIAKQCAATLTYFARKRAETAASHPEEHDMPPREPSNIGTARAVVNAETDLMGEAQEEMARQRAAGMVFPKTYTTYGQFKGGGDLKMTVTGFDLDELFQSPLYDDEMIAGMSDMSVAEVARLRAARKEST